MLLLTLFLMAPLAVRAEGRGSVQSAARQLVARMEAGGVAVSSTFPPVVVGDLVVGAADKRRSTDVALQTYQLLERVPHAPGTGSPSTATEVSDRLWGDAGAITGDHVHGDGDAGGGGHPGVYRQAEAVGRGAYGEVWRALRLRPDGTAEPGSYVLKRLLPHRARAQLSGWREAYFGLHAAIRGGPHVARFVEHFTRHAPREAGAAEHDDDGDPAAELWLVFVDEGVSLGKLIYTPPSAGLGAAPLNGGASTVAALEPSALWARLHAQPRAGRVFVRNVVRQLLLGLAACHAGGIVHRDVKPGNILVATAGDALRLRLADFGSAVDAHAAEHLYPGRGPSRDEATLPYAPPEVRLPPPDAAGGAPPPYDAAAPASYDLFSLGVTLAELMLAQPASELLAPSSATVSLLQQASSWHAGVGGRQRRRGGAEAEPDTALERAILAAGLARLCIAPSNASTVAVDAPWLERPPHRGHHHQHHHQQHAELVDCTLEGFRRVWRRAERWARARAAALLHTRSRAGSKTVVPRDAGGYVVAPTRRGDGHDDAAVVLRRDGNQLQSRVGEDENLSVAPRLPAPLLFSEHLQKVVAAIDASHALVPAAAALPGHGGGGGGVCEAPGATALAVDVLVDAVPTTTGADGAGGGSCNADLPAGGGPDDVPGAARMAAGGDPDDEPSPLLGEDGELLLWRLLAWAPEDRPTAAEALAASPYLQHRYD